MKTKVWLSLLLISSFLFGGCAPKSEAAVSDAEAAIPMQQDTLEMMPDFSYVVTPQVPHIYIDQMGYRSQDQKVAFFLGEDLEEIFTIEDVTSGEVVYSGKLHRVKDIDGKGLYTGNFEQVVTAGKYVVKHPKIGDSYEFVVKDTIYDSEFLVLQKRAKEYNYTNVSDLAYVLANMMFIEELFDEAKTDISFIEKNIVMLLNSQDAKSGAFFSEIFTEPIVPEKTNLPGEEEKLPGTISLTTTAQMAGVLAQYSVLYKDNDPAFAAQCLNVSQKAYRYMEQHRANTDTDAWYYAAVQLYRATGQYKYRSAITEYDIVDPTLHTGTYQGYTILADFAYLLTPRGTDYTRCSTLLDKYMDKAQSISIASSRENFYVPADISAMEQKEILDDMIVLGVVNHILSGQEYAGIQRNYIHYLSGVNMQSYNYLQKDIAGIDFIVGEDITNISKLLVIFGNISES